MKIAKFTIKRSQIDHLIHNLKALQKLHDSPSNKGRFTACNFLEMAYKPSWFNKLFRRDKEPRFRVIIQIERAQAIKQK